MFRVSDNSYYNSLPLERVFFFINLLKRKLEADQNWIIQKVVKDWHVPFVRAFFKPDNISVDVTFSSGLAVENTLLLEHLFIIQPEAAKFCLFVKTWLKINQVSFKNYNAVLLAIFYLQQENFLPTIQEVQEYLPEIFIDGKLSFEPKCF